MLTEKDYNEFVSLVKRMREAQGELETCSIGDYAFRQHCAAQLESEVDEYLKKIKECHGAESNLSSLAKSCPNFAPKDNEL